MATAVHRTAVRLTLGAAGLGTLLAGLAAGGREAAAQGCGGRGQPPCIVETVRAPCYGMGNACYIRSETCDAGLRIDQNHICHVIAGQPIPQPARVSFRDNGREVNAGYVITVDLRRLQEIVPNGSHPRICTGTDVDLTPVIPNTGPVTHESWVDEPDFRPRLAVNGSFYRLVSGSAWDDECTTVFGYTVSQGVNVRPEEQIIAYNMGAPTETFSPGTLLFYANNDRPEGRAEIKWYPFMGSNPGGVPPGVSSAISGVPLIRDGQAVAQTGPEASTPHPRTAVGLRADGNQLVIVSINPGTDDGTTLPGLAAYMIGLGVRNAINLDGGGSAQFYYSDRGVEVKSLPSDTMRGLAGRQRFYRPVANILGFE